MISGHCLPMDVDESVEKGTHQDLLGAGPIYLTLWNVISALIGLDVARLRTNTVISGLVIT